MSILGDDKLNVYLDFGNEPPILIGECRWYASKGALAFQWSNEAHALKLRLSPIVNPLSKSLLIGKPDLFDGLPGLLSDSLPDGFGLRMMNHSFTSAGIAIEDVTSLHRLAWVGASGLGALTYNPVSTVSDNGAKSLMSVEELGAVARRADVENFALIPKETILAGGSAHGARPKFWGAISKDGKNVLLNKDSSLTGFTPCLIKFAPTGGDSNEPFYEYACLQLAKKYGLEAVKGRLLEHPGGAALAVERFDRGAGGERVFVQSLAALINDNFRVPRLDYSHLSKVSKILSNEVSAAENERIYRQACFNVALSMRDDHSKNFAFLMNKSGSWRLSPAFDLCPALGPNGWHTMSVSGEAKSVKRSHLLSFAKNLDLSEGLAKEAIDCALSASNEFGTVLKELGIKNKKSNFWVKQFKVIENDLKAICIPVNKKVL